MRHAVLAVLLAVSSLPAAELTNAAAVRLGARIALELPPGGHYNRDTSPEDVIDGNAHTRCVIENALPYTYVVELLQPLPLVKIGFAQTDYEEQAPSDVTVSVDGGPAAACHLELKRSRGSQPTWQEFPLAVTGRVVRVTVTANYAGKVDWGGMGDIAIWTTADVKALLAIPNYDPQSPVFVHLPPQTAAGAVAKVTLPPVAAAGEHPCLMLTKAEVAQLKEDLKQGTGPASLAKLRGVADAVLAKPLALPDPHGPLAEVIKFNHDRVTNACGSLGLAWQLLGDLRYAQRVRETLLAYAARYRDYPEHKGANPNDMGKLSFQRLSEAMIVIPLLEAWDYTWDSGLYTEADQQAITEGLVKPAVTYIRRAQPAAEAADRTRADRNWRTDDPPTKKGFVANWVQYYNAATLFAGILTGNRDWIDLALAETRYNLHNGIGADGMWNEGAIGYQFFVMRAFNLILEAAARQGVDLWSFDGCHYKQLFDSPLRYVYPDGSAPGINDSTRDSLGGWETEIYDYAWLRYGDPLYARLINNSERQLIMTEDIYNPTRIYTPLPTSAALRLPSTIFASLGFAILRDSPDLPQPRYALLKYGPHGGTHGHYDKLNLILYQGDELGGEPVFHRYVPTVDPLHAQWTVQTVAHNAMVIDQRRQAAAEGRLTAFEDAGDLKVARAEDADAYAGVLLDRCVVVTPTTIVDLARATSRREVTLDRTLRFNGVFPDRAAPTAETLGTQDGYEHLKLVARRPLAAAATFDWQTRAGRLHATAAGGPGLEALVARGPDDDDMVLVRRHGKIDDIAVAYRLDGPAPKLATVDTGDPDVVAAQTDDALIIVSHRPGPWQAAGWRGDAQVAVIAGGQGLIVGGTSLGHGASEVKLPAAGNARVTVGEGLAVAGEAWRP
jgi:hypothetical protein